MWMCPYCGSSKGQPFSDAQLSGMLCLNPDCGRFDSTLDAEQVNSDWDDSDL